MSWKPGRSVLLALVAGLTVALVAACSSAEEPAAPAAPAPTATSAPSAAPTATTVPPTATPSGPTRTGGTLTVSDAQPTIADAILFQVLSSSQGPKLYLEYLIGYNAETTAYEPQLATAWEQSTDGLEWTYTIRENVAWHNGGTVTPEDVKFSFDIWQHANPAAPNYAEIELFTNDVSVSGNKVTTKTAGPMFTVPYRTSSLTTNTILPKAHFESLVSKTGEIWPFQDYAEDPVGSGPYKLIEHKQGERWKYEAVKDHWRVTPDFDALEIIWVKESSTRIAMLRTGAADIITISRAQAKEVKDAGHNVVASPLADISMYLWPFGQYHGPDTLTDPNPRVYDPTNPLDNLHFRKALSYDIDRETIIDVLFAGYGIPDTQGLFLKSDPAYNHDAWKVDPYDPPMAREYLKAAGYENGEGVGDLWFGSFVRGMAPELQEYVETLTQTWKKDLGVEFEIVLTEYSALRQKQLRGRDGARWIVPLPLSIFPDYSLGVLYTCHGYYGVCGVSEYPQTEALFEELRFVKTKADETRVLREIGDFLYTGRHHLNCCMIQALLGTNSAKIDSYAYITHGAALGALEYVNVPR